MRAWKLGTAVGLAGVAGSAILVGCLDSSDGICELNGNCPSVSAPRDGGGDSDATVGPDSPGDDGSQDGSDDAPDVYIPPDAGPCTAQLDPHDGCYAVEGTGLFVDATALGDAAAADGSPKSPYHRISDAIAAMSGAEPKGQGRIYVCGSGKNYDETVTVTAGLATDVAIYGNLSCNTWAWTQSAGVLVKPSAGGYALSIAGATKKIAIHDVSFESPTAMGYDGTGAGNSSIAAFLSNATDVTFVRASFKAGAGAGGKSPMAQPDWSPASAPVGNIGTAGAGGAAQPASGSFSCPGTSGSTKGGAGGDPSTGGSPGGPGTLPVFPAGFNGGAGQVGPPCTNGGDGSYGPGGKTVAGASGSGGAVGVLTASGWSPGNGLVGGTGTAAQGGGGGGGGSAGGGGGGGQGGCGGTGGSPGTGSGASIGLLVFQSPVKLVSCTVSVTAGATGGAGGKGQNGQLGGTRGVGGGTNGCNGGGGGTGGSGGGGGGGGGGTSVGIGYLGPAPTIDGTSVSDSTPAVGTIGAGAGGGAGPFGAAGTAGASTPPGEIGDNGTVGTVGIGGAVKPLPGS